MATSGSRMKPLGRVVLFAGWLAAVGSARCHAGAISTQSGRKVFLRGIGWSPWHATEGWHHSQATRQLDLRLLREAHINCLRTWGPATRRGVEQRYEQGFYWVPTVGRKGLKPSRFADGTKKGVSFLLPENVQRFRELARAAAEQVAGLEGCPVLLLGNEYSWVGRNKSGNWAYLGFDDLTQREYRQWLQRRFGSVDVLNASCGTQLQSFENVRPPGKGRLRYQWWLFLREAFEAYMRAGYEAAKKAAPSLNISYAKLMGTHWDPCTEDARLQFLDVQGDNLYWHWKKDWAWYDAYLNDLIANAPDRPALITESGFPTIPLGPDRAARLMKQMLANLLMHAQVGGVCVYAYSDEWYVDGDPTTQAPTESWGIVTAHRRIKPSYGAVQEVYGLIQRRLEPYLLSAHAQPVVWVSGQDLDGILGGHDTSRRVEVIRALYNLGVEFATLNSEDLCRVDELFPSRLILCDDVLRNEPARAVSGNGGADAGAALERYLRAGGQVLYVAERPFEALYGRLRISAELASLASSGRPAPTKVSLGQGSITLVRRAALTPRQARELVRTFVRESTKSRPVAVSRVRPAEAVDGIFWRIWQGEAERVVWLVNNSNGPVDLSLRIRRGKLAVVGTDSATVEKGAHEMVLHSLNTYAVLLWSPGTS